MNLIEKLIKENGLKPTLAIKKEADVRLTKNFHLSEMQCRCSQCKVTLVNTKHIILLQAFRDLLGKPIHIASGYRCEYHNGPNGVNGSKNSFHMQGDATDIIVRGMSAKDVHKAAEEFNFDGIGKYFGFVHVDSRGYIARW